MEKQKIYKLVDKYKYYNMKRRKPIQTESMTDKSKTDEVDIYKCIEKYGIQTMIRQTKAKENILNYCDATPMMMTLDEKIEYRNQIDEYFKELPAIIRKKYGDNSTEFYNKFKNGDFKEMIEADIITEDIAKKYQEEIEKYNKETIENAKEEIRKKIQIENEVINEENIE